MTQSSSREPSSPVLSHDAPLLLVEAAPWRKTFFQNISDLIWPKRLPALHLSSTPAEFWPDVFVTAALPWKRVPLSGILHAMAIAAMLIAPEFFPQPAHVLRQARFDSRDVISFSPSEELPPLDTGKQPVRPNRRGDPGFAPQPILSVPPETQNSRQTLVTPPDIRLKADVPMPNVIAWKQVAPAVPMAATNNLQSHAVEKLRLDAVAPVPQLSELASRTMTLSQPSVVAPQPQLQANLSRHIGQLNIGHQQVVLPAPKLPVAESHIATGVARLGDVRVAEPQPTLTMAAARDKITLPESTAVAPAPAALSASLQHSERPPGRGLAQPQVVAPAPAVSRLDSHANNRVTIGNAAAAVPPAPGVPFQSSPNDRQLIALNLHPAAAVAPPEGNRRGTFAATPQGKPEASGLPDQTAKGDVASGHQFDSLPPGLHVGNKPDAGKETNAKSNAGQDRSASPDADHPLMASVSVPRVSGRPAKEVPEVSATDQDRRIFAGHKFYSMALNFANLNSSGGSWIFHFAERENNEKGVLMAPEVERQVDPAYPTELMRHNVHGTVVLYAIVGSDGLVSDVRVLESVDDRLDEYAREALIKWRFHPATKNGSPVSLTMVVKVPFRPSQNLF